MFWVGETLAAPWEGDSRPTAAEMVEEIVAR